MTPEEFRGEAGRMWEEIPLEMRQGVEALSVEDPAVPHPFLTDILTLGECLTDSLGAAFEGEGGVRSTLLLHYGSFAELARRDPAFDWEHELWETILHELLHHREAAAGEDGLDVYDWAAEQNFRRHAGRPFDPDFHLAVPRDPDGAVRVDSEVFVESTVSEGATEARFGWRSRSYVVRVPAGPAMAFVEIGNLARGRLWLVVRRRRPWWRRWFGGASDESPLELSRRALPVPAA